MQSSAQENNVPTRDGLAPDTQVASQVTRLPNGRYPKGVSGNPKRHQQWLERERQRIAYEKQLLGDIIAECGELSALDLGFARQAAAMLASATFRKGKADVMMRLTWRAMQLVERLKVSAKARQAASPITKFDEYLKQRAG